MNKEIRLTVVCESPRYGELQEKEQEFKVCLEQIGILLTPERYEKVFEKLKEIQGYLNAEQSASLSS